MAQWPELFPLDAKAAVLRLRHWASHGSTGASNRAPERLEVERGRALESALEAVKARDTKALKQRWQWAIRGDGGGATAAQEVVRLVGNELVASGTGLFVVGAAGGRSGVSAPLVPK